MKADDNIERAVNLPTAEQITEWFEGLSKALDQSAQRLLLICRGDSDWTLALSESMPALEPRFIISNREAFGGATPLARSASLLGQESRWVIVDGCDGLDLDVLCMAAGLVRAGGALVLLLPRQHDPARDRYGRWQDRVPSRAWFIDYLENRLSRHDACLEWRQYDALPDIPLLAYAGRVDLQQGVSDEQRELLQRLSDWWHSGTACFVVTAERGRGKSTALGMFAAQPTIATGVVVTAASRKQASVLLRVAVARGVELPFKAPAEIAASNQRLRLLIIDEAAMLPHKLLWQCLERADKVLLATTTGGYEGTGQGFLLRFLARLDQRGYLRGGLIQPVRWGPRDLLEPLLNQALLLEPEPESNIRGVDDAALDDLQIRPVSRAQLAGDLALLQSIYALLVSAHYRTRPSDLRQLMEDENLQLLVAFDDRRVLGVLLLNREGGFSPELSEQVFLGLRRPRGHLLAQMLTAQAGIRHFACASGYRVQRLAVDEGCRRRGIGRALIGAAQDMLRDQGLDYLASSFALDSDNALFWQALCFRLVHIGSGSGKSTGRQSIAVIHPASPRVRHWVGQLEKRFASSLPIWLLSYCNRLDAREVLTLLAWRHDYPAPDDLACDEIEAFCRGFRGLELAQAALQRLLLNTLVSAPLDERDAILLIERILLDRPWSWFNVSGQGGKRELLGRLRGAVDHCYRYYREYQHE